MKLFAIRSEDDELYFHLEKTNSGLDILDTIAGLLFGTTEFFFDMEWQNGLPKQESYLGHTFKGVYIGAVVSEKRIHLLIRGLKDAKKIKAIKDMVLEKHTLVAPEHI